MTLCQSTGWEYLSSNPVDFFTQVLLQQLSPAQKEHLRGLVRGDKRLGLVWSDGKLPGVDEATLVSGIVLWAAATRHRPTQLWGGRRSMACAWMDHAACLLRAARSDFRHGFQLVRAGSDITRPWGIRMPNGLWVLRYDGTSAEDAQQAVQDMGNCANVLIGDFDWVDQESMQQALRYADHEQALVSVVVGQYVRSQ